MKKLLIILIFVLLVQVQGWCATKYLRNVGGTANWNDNNSWSTTSNGSADTTYPTSADDVVCDPNSGGSTVLTVNVASACKSLNMADFVGTLAGGYSLNIAGNLSMGSGMINNCYSVITISDTSTIASNTKSFLNTLLISATGKTVQLSDNLTINNNGLYIYLGTFTTNSKNIICNGFNGLGSGTKIINLGNSNITCASIDLTGTNLTFNYDTSTIIVNQSATGAMSFVYGTTQFYDLTLNGYASTGCYKAFAGNLTVNNTLTIAGNSAINKLALKSSNTTVRTITAPTVNLSNIDYYQNIKGAGDGWIGKVPFFNSSSTWNPNLKYSGVLR